MSNPVQERGYEHLEAIVDIVHDHLSRAPLKSTRCFYTTTVLMHFLESRGFETNRWEGSVRWFSRKYIELAQQGYDFSTGKNKTPEQIRKRQEALRAKGVRVLECLANEGGEDDLGGHLCVLARNESQAFFIDPTSFQFQRDDPNPGGRIHAPETLIAPLKHRNIDQLPELLCKEKFMAGYYFHQPVDKYRKLLGLPDEQALGTNLNPHRLPDVTEAIETAVSEWESKRLDQP